jgi:menaquinone-dependent protoporphyrinogen oxidase
MHVLIAYASRHGATAEIAQAIANTLTETGVDADCRPAGDVDSLDGYDAVVLGSAVYMRRWRAEARHFLRHHGDALAAMPFWIFSSGPVGEPQADHSEDAWTVPHKVVERAQQLGVREHVVFGGRVPTPPHGPVQRSMYDNTPPEYRDRRDWDAIAAWARGIAAALPAATPR